VLTSDNPYASNNTAVFTSGAGQGSGPVVSKQTMAAPTFGVSGGTAQLDPRREKELLSWRARVQQELARLATQNYPRRALKLGQQGTAKVTVTIDESGTLVGASLAQGSGVASLDQAALERLQSGAKVSAPPAGAGTNRLTLPITFRIN
jgi:TonB family protein